MYAAKLKNNARTAHAQAVKIGKAVKRDILAVTPLRIIEECALLVVALQIMILGVNALTHTKPVLGLRLEGQLVGQLGNDAQSQTESIIQNHESRSLTIRAGQVTDTVTLRQLGSVIDQKQVYKTLLEKGRSGNPLQQVIEQDMAAIGARNILLENSSLNHTATTAYLAGLNKKITTKPSNARFILHGKQIQIQPDVAGHTLELETARQMLNNAHLTADVSIDLPVKSIPAAIRQSSLETLLPQVQSITREPLTITAGKSRTTLSPKQLLDVMTLKVIPAATPSDETVSLSFNQSKLTAAIDKTLRQAIVAPTPTIMRGEQVITQGTSGTRTTDDRTLVKILAVLVQRQHNISTPREVIIPLATVSPPIVQQAINEPLRRTGTGSIRLTFDDGPGAYTEQILTILKQYNVHATFYVIGQNAERYPSTIKRIVNEGHRIGNHSFSHTDLTHLSQAGIQQELGSTQAAIRAACGIAPTAFRPPYGATNSTVQAVAASMGMSVDLWSVDTNDWAQPGSSVITQRVLSSTNPGAVVLLHVLHQQTVTALPSIIEGIRSQGYKLE